MHRGWSLERVGQCDALVMHTGSIAAARAAAWPVVQLSGFVSVFECKGFNPKKGACWPVRQTSCMRADAPAG